MKIDKYYMMGFGAWMLSLVFVSLAAKMLINVVIIQQITSYGFSIISWICVLIWIRRKQKKNWRNL